MLVVIKYNSWGNDSGDDIMKLTKWFNKEWDIEIDTGEPSKYIDDLLAPLKYHKRWRHKELQYILRDEIPYKFERENYKLTYNIKRKDNEDKEEFDFIMYLIDKAVDYINNLEVLLAGDEYDTEDDSEIPF